MAAAKKPPAKTAPAKTTEPAAETAPAKTTKPAAQKADDLTIAVHSIDASFRRGGQAFTRESRTISQADVGRANWDAIMNEPRLVKVAVKA